jgi:hypothetical protein
LKDFESGLLDAPVDDPQSPIDFLLDDFSQAGALLDIGRLGHVPEDHFDVVFGVVGDAFLELPARIFEIRKLPGLLVGGVHVHEERFGAVGFVPDRAVDVDADKQKGVVVVGYGRPVFERGVEVLLPGQNDPIGHGLLDQGFELEAQGERHVFFETAEFSFRSDIEAPVSGVDHDGFQRRRGAGVRSEGKSERGRRKGKKNRENRNQGSAGRKNGARRTERNAHGISILSVFDSRIHSEAGRQENPPSGGGWWRRRESNPRPKTFSGKNLHAYPLH